MFKKKNCSCYFDHWGNIHVAQFVLAVKASLINFVTKKKIRNGKHIKWINFFIINFNMTLNGTNSSRCCDEM